MRTHMTLRALTLGVLLGLSAFAAQCGGTGATPPGVAPKANGAPARLSPQPSAPPLFEAVKKGDVYELKRLLAGGADPNVYNDIGVTPLDVAVAKGDAETIRALLAGGADPNAEMQTSGDTALTVAVKLRDPLVALLLLDKGADVNLRPKSEHGAAALHVAARNGDLEMLNLLLSRGAEPDVRDARGNTPLMTGAEYTPVIEALVAKGADVNARNEAGVTPLRSAVSSTEALRILIGHGADVNARNKAQWSVLEEALLRGCPDAVNILKQAGAAE
ncbi:MAG: ankyrin repeat domain-containing protein [Pyrinomonadaceae bacterium]